MITQLDITQYKGKQADLQELILEQCKTMSQNNNLPSLMVMTSKQYKTLKKADEFGNKNELKANYRPQDRIYCTPYNAMEIEIK